MGVCPISALLRITLWRYQRLSQAVQGVPAPTENITGSALNITPPTGNNKCGPLNFINLHDFGEVRLKLGPRLQRRALPVYPGSHSYNKAFNEKNGWFN